MAEAALGATVFDNDDFVPKRKDKYAHGVFNKGQVITMRGGDQYIIDEVLQYGEFGDLYRVNSMGLKDRKIFQLRTEIVRPPKAFQVFKWIALFMEEQLACKKNKKKHFIFAEGCGGDRNVKYMVSQNLGPTLPDLRRYFVSANFSIPDALALATQAYEAINALHELGFVHGDLAPSAFSLGVGSHESTLFLSNFGRIRKHLDRNGMPVKEREKVPFYGNIIYSSRSSHKRKDFSRTDDLESWIYLSGDLFDDSTPPWKPKKRTDIPAEEELLAKKEEFMRAPEAQSTFFNFTPQEFQPLLSIVMGLNYEAIPPYHVFKAAIADAKKRIGGAKSPKWIGHSQAPHIYPEPKRPKTGLRNKGDTVTQDVSVEEEEGAEAQPLQPKKKAKTKKMNIPKRKKASKGKEEGELPAARKGESTVGAAQGTDDTPNTEKTAMDEDGKGTEIKKKKKSAKQEVSVEEEDDGQEPTTENAENKPKKRKKRSAVKQQRAGKKPSCTDNEEDEKSARSPVQT